MTGVDDLVAFVRQQLDDDARVAREATTGPWHVGDVARDLNIADVCAANDRVTSAYSEPCCAVEDATHIARWDPARVLAEVEAERLQVAFAEVLLRPVPTPPGYPASARMLKLEVELAEEQAATMMLKLLARPYAGRNGWHDEWAVNT